MEADWKRPWTTPEEVEGQGRVGTEACTGALPADVDKVTKLGWKSCEVPSIEDRLDMTSGGLCVAASSEEVWKTEF